MKATEAKQITDSVGLTIDDVYRKIEKSAKKGKHYRSFGQTELLPNVVNELRQDGYDVYQSTHEMSDGSITISWGEPRRIKNNCCKKWWKI